LPLSVQDIGAGFGNFFEDRRLVGGVAFDGIDEVRNKVRAALEKLAD
jgi:hypothetical protein